MMLGDREGMTVKAFSAKLENPSSVPGTHMVKREN